MSDRKIFKGSVPGGLIAFAVESPTSPTERNFTGFVHRMWCTGEVTGCVINGEQRAFAGVHIVGVTLGRPACLTELYVAGSIITVEKMLDGLKHLPDYGVDLTALRPHAQCLLNKPCRHDDGLELHALKFARLEIGGGAVR